MLLSLFEEKWHAMSGTKKIDICVMKLQLPSMFIQNCHVYADGVATCSDVIKVLIVSCNTAKTILPSVLRRKFHMWHCQIAMCTCMGKLNQLI